MLFLFFPFGLCDLISVCCGESRKADILIDHEVLMDIYMLKKIVWCLSPLQKVK